MKIPHIVVLLALIGCGSRPPATPSSAPRPSSPQPLADSDLSAAGLVFGMAADTVRSRFGTPDPTSTENVWSYTGLRVYLREGQVHQIEIRSPSYEAARQLRVGLDTAAVTRAFGRSCVQGALAYCRTVGSEPDERGILLESEHGVVTAIRVGAVFDLD